MAAMAELDFRNNLKVIFYEMCVQEVGNKIFKNLIWYGNSGGLGALRLMCNKMKIGKNL
jgi:hypothetical protein